MTKFELKGRPRRRPCRRQRTEQAGSLEKSEICDFVSRPLAEYEVRCYNLRIQFRGAVKGVVWWGAVKSYPKKLFYYCVRKSEQSEQRWKECKFVNLPSELRESELL